MKSRKNIHYAWAVLIACCAIQAGSLGAISNCKGVFYDAICTELGMSLGTFTLQGVFAGIASAAMTPMAMKLLKKYPMHKALFLACVVYSGTQFIMSYFNDSVFLWYFAAIIQAVAGAFLLFLPVPIILNRWFAKKKGLATAIATSFSGLSSMLLNPVYASITEQFGWRAGYRFVGILSFLLMGPILLLVLRGTPEEKGLRPYGEEGQQAETTAAVECLDKLDRHGMLRMTCLILMAVCVSCGSCFQSHLTKYGITIGMSLRISALLPSAAMLGSVIFKPTMGVCADKIGPNRTASLFFGLNILGFTMLLLSDVSMLCLYVGSFLCGVSMAANVVLFPLLIGNALKGYDFDRYYSYLSMAISMTGVSAGAVFGYLFDWTNSYFPSFVVLLIAAVVNFMSLRIMIFAMKHGRCGAAL